MLVCNVSLRAPRRAIAADLAEAATAADATATGNVAFATLIDDPANVRDSVDAYLGEIMVEAASAADVLTAGSDYNAAVDEGTTATDVQDGTIPSVTAQATRMQSASRPGLGSVVVSDDGAGKTRVISNIGAVS